jgi:hypothetical protein
MVDSVKNNSRKSQKDSSQSSTNTATSTLSLFTTILSKAESDYLAASSSPSSKAKLFHIATQLARLNLSEEIEGEEGEDTASTEQAIQLWCIFLRFIIRYPDYALYRIIDNGSTSQAKQQEKKKKEGGRVNGTNDQQEEQHDGENGNRQHEEENDDDEDEQQGEEMIYWLLPRLLRAIALSNSHSSPRSRRKQQTESSEHNDLEQAQRDEHVEKDENDITQQGEQWISNVIENYSRIFYHREEGGQGKRRYLVKVLIKIANGQHISLLTL